MKKIIAIQLKKIVLKSAKNLILSLLICFITAAGIVAKATLPFFLFILAGADVGPAFGMALTIMLFVPAICDEAEEITSKVCNTLEKQM